MPSLDLFDYPPHEPKEPDPELKAFAERVKKYMVGRDVVIITAKEGGGARNIVDTCIEIVPTNPRNSGDVWTVTRTKVRPSGNPDFTFDFTKPLGE